MLTLRGNRDRLLAELARKVAEDEMRMSRTLIVAVIFLGVGLWLIFAYCNGNAGLNLGTPISNTKLTIDLTTMGAPVLIGLPLIVLGMLLLAIAFIAAIIAQFRSRETPPQIEAPSRWSLYHEGKRPGSRRQA